MAAGEMERGVQRPRLTEQTTFKLIWVRSTLFVQWQHTDPRMITRGLLATNFIFHQTQSPGTRTMKIMRKK